MQCFIVYTLHYVHNTDPHWDVMRVHSAL